MPWNEVSVMDQRREFVRLFEQGGSTHAELCRRFKISRKTGYKWRERAESGLPGWAGDRSRRPHNSPGQSEAAIEGRVLSVRDAHPAWGARKIEAWLTRKGGTPPAPSTIHGILVRHGRIVELERQTAFKRFEHVAPNLVWQMDFKGRFELRDRRWCHALTVVDDHSRYALCLAACSNEQGDTVRRHLTQVFGQYGLPDAFLVDNGTPWGNGPERGWTRFGVWLLKLGVEVIYARPYHPQTRGKNERFHRTLKAEVLALRTFRSLTEVQAAFDHWRELYNHERPHEALGLAVPASRYRVSPRPMPRKLLEPEYTSDDIVRRVGTTKSYISFKGRLWAVPQAFLGERVALRPMDDKGCYGIFFGAREIARLDLEAARRRGARDVDK
ncbi:MAG TPA: IS481 family transposase [Kofleriaceae bacterium]|nr:IS481 family transposase [Kofleriaceae bacterium]